MAVRLAIVKNEKQSHQHKLLTKKVIVTEQEFLNPTIASNYAFGQFYQQLPAIFMQRSTSV
jgi:hypothetical protein